jgi:hypothetical protein
MRKILLIIMILMVPLGLAATSDTANLANGKNVLFVDIKNGDCSNDYTRTKALSGLTPWCNLDAAFSKMQSGDTVYIQDGTYRSESGFVLKDKSFSSKVTITAYPQANPVITSAVNSLEKVPNTKWTKGDSNTWYTSYDSGKDTWAAAYVSGEQALFTYSREGNIQTSLSALKSTSNPEGVYFDNANNKLYVRFDSTSKNPNSIGLELSAEPVILLNNVDGLEISDLRIYWGVYGIQIVSSSDIDIIGNTIKGGINGLDVSGGSDVILRDNTITLKASSDWSWQDDLKSSAMEGTGIWTQEFGSGLDIDGNSVSGYFNGIYMSSTSKGKFRDAKIRGNTIEKIHDDGIEIEDYCNGAQITGNTVTDSFVGISLSPTDATEKKCTISKNVFVPGPIKWDHSGTVGSGECYKIIDTAGARNLDILSNTCVGRGVFTTDSMTHTQRSVTWRDNLFYAISDRILDKSGLSADGVSYDYNLYYRSEDGPLFRYWNSDSSTTDYDTLASAKASSRWDGKWDVHSKEANPLFVSLSGGDYRPKSTSPACKMSSTGSYVGALACQGGSTTNHAPTQSKPTLRAADYPLNTTNADLVCTPQGTADSDGDDVSNSFRWFNNSKVVSGQTKNTLSNALTRSGDSWVCEVKPFDGLLYGTAMSSNAVKINAAQATCGNNKCDPSESCSSCPDDCGECKPVCGDGSCSGSETCTSCSKDCGACAPKCGDNVCNGNEDCSTCSKDCGSCATCGDGKCGSGETCKTCEDDCGACPKPHGGGGGGGGSICIEDWICFNWTECSFLNYSYRDCYDAHNCDTEGSKPLIQKTCVYGEPVLQDDGTRQEPAAPENLSEEPQEPIASFTPIAEPKTPENSSDNESIGVAGELKSTVSNVKESASEITGHAIAAASGGSTTGFLLFFILLLGGVAVVISTGADPFKQVREYTTRYMNYFTGVAFTKTRTQTKPQASSQLKVWVKLARENGFDDQYIERFLRTNGWKDDVVKSLLFDLSASYERQEQAVNEKLSAWYGYFAEHLRLGHTLDSIQRNLIHNLGYERSVIEYLIKSYEHDMDQKEP